MKRWKRILVQVLVAAQLISAAPFASAMGGSNADAPPCDGMMDMASASSDSGHCPCCPDGVDSLAACLAACSAAFGIAPSVSVSQVRTLSLRINLADDTSHSRVFDPPLKPPPIA